MRTRDEIAKDAGCTELEYKDNISVRIGLLTLEVLADIRDQNDRIISLLQDIARGNKPINKYDIENDPSFVRGGSNVTLASSPYHNANTSIVMSR
jgi:hypothetical protein